MYIVILIQMQLLGCSKVVTWVNPQSRFVDGTWTFLQSLLLVQNGGGFLERTRTELPTQCNHVPASPPCRACWRDLASPLPRPWRKTCPTPLQSRNLDCQGSSNFRLHSLSSRVSVALVAPTFQGLIHVQFNESCQNPEIFLKVFENISSWRARGVPP